MDTDEVHTVPGTTQTIPESTFLLTELEYTLGQLHVQLGDLDSEQAAATFQGKESVNQIVNDMIDCERKYQSQYTQLLGSSAPSEEVPVPLPVYKGEEAQGPRATFEHLRAATIDMLMKAPEPWAHDLIETVKQQVAEDRQYTTAIAELRKESFETPTRPDLDKPLTPPDQQPTPGQLASGEESSHPG